MKMYELYVMWKVKWFAVIVVQDIIAVMNISDMIISIFISLSVN